MKAFHVSFPLLKSIWPQSWALIGIISHTSITLFCLKSQWSGTSVQDEDEWKSGSDQEASPGWNDKWLVWAKSCEEIQEWKEESKRSDVEKCPTCSQLDNILCGFLDTLFCTPIQSLVTLKWYPFKLTFCSIGLCTLYSWQQSIYLRPTLRTYWI